MSRRDATPDTHLFPTRPYDLVKELVVALVVVGTVILLCAGLFSSPDSKAVGLGDWAGRAPDDVVATAVGELAGSTTSAGYGPPYNTASSGQQLGPLSLQKWAGVRIPVDSATDLVLAPLQQASATDPALRAALAQWAGATPDQRTAWATAYADVLTATPDAYRNGPERDPRYGPVPVLATRYLALARSGSLESAIRGSASFYGLDETRALLLLSDGSYLEGLARADHLGGDQWGMMNETGNYPGQPWMWLYTFWYQIPPFSTSDNADALVWGLMVVLTLVLVLVPYIPGLRAVPKKLRLYRLVWRPVRRPGTAEGSAGPLP